MKKIILTFIFSVIISCGTNIVAQSDYRMFDNSNDGFFDANNSSVMTYRSDDDATNLPNLPRIGTSCNQKAPIGSGVVLLAGLGISYLTLKKKKKRNE